jgi:dihydrofolate reductase
MKISLIAALSENYVIGKDRGMPWHMPEDLKYFFKVTKGHHVIMGRKTFNEFGVSKPLPDRTNLIVSRQKDLKIDDAIVFNSIQEALDFAENKGEKEAFIIGGGNIYNQSIEFADKLYLTYIHTNINDGDTFFPDFNKEDWTLTKKDKRRKDEKNPFDYTFTVYEKK